MAENKQNSETQNPSAGGKQMAGGSAASTQKTPDHTADKKTAPGATGVGSTGESVGQAAAQVAGQVKDKAVSLIGEQKAGIATGINSVADSIRQIGTQLGSEGDNPIASLASKYGDSLAGQVEKFSHYIEDRELKEVARDVEQFARRNPSLFVGGAFVLGIVAARFLKSSGSAQNRRGRLTHGNSPAGTAVQAS